MSTLQAVRDGVSALASSAGPSAGDVLHVCALHRGSEDGIYYNIHINEHSPKCPTDWLLLNLTRSVASRVITSATNLRHEGGQAVTVDLSLFGAEGDTVVVGDGPSSGAAAAATTSSPLQQRRMAAVLTHGRTLDARWPFFSREGAEQHKGPRFEPAIVCPKEQADHVRGLFDTAARPHPELLALWSESELSLEAVLRYMQHQMRAGAEGSAEGGQTQMHRGAISIECGPSSTRPLYIQKPDGADADDLLVWVSKGAPRFDCPVDWLLLSAHSGDIDSRSLGAEEPVIAQTTIDALFDVVASTAGAPTVILEGDKRSEWTFTLYRRKRA
jgi:hypothetical protein